MKTCVLFDLDGTLLDTLADLTDAVNYTMAHYGCPARTQQQVRDFVGNGAVRLMAQALPGWETDPDPRDAVQVFQDYYREHCNIKTGPYDGIPEALAEIGAKYPVGIVTNKPHSAAVPLCRAQFPGIYTLGEEAPCPRKPAPDMIRKAMAALDAGRCIYVGDSEVDILTAANSGVPCICVTWGMRTQAQLCAAGAVRLCSHPRELPAAIEALISEVSENGK